MKIRILAASLLISLASSSPAEESTPTPVPEGPKLKFSGVIQADNRTFFEDSKIPLNNEILLRRVRLQIDSEAGPKLKVRVQGEFAGVAPSLIDAFADLKLLPWASLRIGRFKTPLSLERWRSDPDRDFVELGFTASLVTDRDQGFIFELADPGQIVSLQGGVVNGGNDGASPAGDQEDDKDGFARLFLHPLRAVEGSELRDLGLGLAATGGHRGGTAALPSYKSPGQATIFSYAAGTTITGQAWRLAPQAYLYWRNFSLLGELVKSELQVQRANSLPGLDQAWIHHDAWQIQGTWVLTGENSSFKGVKLHDLSSSWGSLALLGRYEELRFDAETFNQTGAARFASLTSSISRARSWTAGFSYIPLNNSKILLHYTETSYTDGALSAGLQSDREAEKVLFARAQFTY